MKKLFILILFLPLFSCNDWLQVESEESVTYRNYFQSEQDVADIYITMLGLERGILANPFVHVLDWSSIYCDIPLLGTDVFRNLDQKSYEGINESDWQALYQVIYLANMLEENRHRFKNVSEERANFWIAQANFLKGLMYFEIARRWGEAPIAPGTEDATAKAKSPADTVLAYAIRAAEAALILPTHDKLTDAKGNAISSRQYASIGSVHTLLANIYAWQGGLHGDEKYWKKAEQEASLVIDGKAGSYDLVSMTDLVEKTFGSARDVTEVIHAIELNYSTDLDLYEVNALECRYPGLAMIDYPYTETNPMLIESKSLSKIRVTTVENLYHEEKDLRRQEYWLNLGEPITIKIDEENSLDYTPRYAYLNKWRNIIYSVNPTVNQGGTKVVAMDGNRVYWRLADLILLRAECRTHLGMSEAVKDLNRIRQRAGLGEYRGSTAKNALLKEIFDERDRELFGETCRYFDIVRNGYIKDELHGNYLTLTDEDVKNGALYLPVGSNAFNKNTLMKQNTYWSWYIKY